MNQPQRGSSLIEVMVSLLVLAIGILGILGMQAKSMQYNQSANAYSQAIFLGSDLAERIRSNRGPAGIEAYDVDTMPTAAGAECDNANVTCTASQLATWDLYYWDLRVKNSLPAGQSAVSQVTYGTRNYMDIQVSFDDTRSENQDPSQAAQGETGITRKTYRLMVEI